MPTNLSETATFDSPIAVPIDADPGNAASVQAPFQALTNRTAFLKGVLDGGVPRVRHGTRVAMRAVAGAVTGDVFIVDQDGVYTFDASSVLTESTPWVVQPNAGSGRWIHTLYAVRNIPNGIPTLDGSSKLAASQTPQRTLSFVVNVPYGTSSVLTGGTVQDFTGYSMSLGALDAGDVVIADCMLGYFLCNSVGGNLRLTLSSGGVDTDMAASLTSAPYVNLNAMTASSIRRHVIAVGGTYTLRARGQNNGGRIDNYGMGGLCALVLKA